MVFCEIDWGLTIALLLAMAFFYAAKFIVWFGWILPAFVSVVCFRKRCRVPAAIVLAVSVLWLAVVLIARPMEYVKIAT